MQAVAEGAGLLATVGGGFDTAGWIVAGLAVLMTGISKSALGGALGGLAVPFMAMWLPAREAAAVMLPILVLMDLVGIRAFWGRASMPELKTLIPAALVGIALGTLTFGLVPDRGVKAVIGAIAVWFAIDRVMRRGAKPAAEPGRARAWLWGGVSGVTSTLAHAGGPPLLVYLLGRGLPRETFVATTVFYFAVINAAKVPFYVGLGLFSRESLLISLCFAPLVPLGVWLGMRLLTRLPERPFYVFATAALGLSGLKLIQEAFS